MATKQVSDSEWEPDAVGDEIQFDSFARRAGASLRSDPPEDGITSVVRRGHRQQTTRRLVQVGVVGVLVVSGIAVLRHSDTTQHNVNTPPQPTTPPTVPPTASAVPTSIASAEEISQWFLDYTGNPIGPTSGDPVKFGIVMPSYTYQSQLNATAAYLTEHAGGVGGRPIELEVCQVSMTECADQFAADPAVIAVLENRWSSDSIGAALGGRKPLHSTYWGGGTPGVGYYPTYRETVNAMALQAKKLTVPGDRILVIDAATDQKDIQDTSLTAFVTPDVSSILTDREVVSLKATATETLADAIRRVGATDAEAIVLATPPLDINFTVSAFGRLVCDDLTDSLDQLGIQPAVIVDGCEPHEGWYELDTGLNPTSPDLQSGALPITVTMPGLGDAKGTAGPRGIREVGALLAVIRVINQLGGPAQATPAALDQAMREFTGPVPLGAGPLDCSPSGKSPNVCSQGAACDSSTSTSSFTTAGSTWPRSTSAPDPKQLIWRRRRAAPVT